MHKPTENNISMKHDKMIIVRFLKALVLENREACFNCSQFLLFSCNSEFIAHYSVKNVRITIYKLTLVRKKKSLKA